VQLCQPEAARTSADMENLDQLLEAEQQKASLLEMRLKALLANHQAAQEELATRRYELNMAPKKADQAVLAGVVDSLSTLRVATGGPLRLASSQQPQQ